MAWIESHQELRRHPKTKRLARLLGIPIPQAIGHLHCLWWWALDYAEDGYLDKFDAFDIAEAAMYEGDADGFLAALINCGPKDDPGFVDADTLQLHDWDEYAGRLIEKRAANAERARKSRERKEDRARNVRATNAQRAGLPDQTVPNLTKPNQTDDNAREVAAASDEPESSVVDEPDFDKNVATIVRAWEEVSGQMGGEEYLQPLFDWLDAGMEAGAIAEAIRCGAEQKARASPPEYLHPKYAAAICRNWHLQGIHTTGAAKRKRESERPQDLDDFEAEMRAITRKEAAI